MPDLRRLRAFLAVAEELSFTRAAERLHVGQQAVSKSIRGLERELGVELFERTTREVRLTPAGLALQQRGGPAVLAVDEAFDAAREAGGGLRGSVTVGVSPAVGPAERQDLVRALRDGAPELSVSLVELRPREVPRALRDRLVDLVVARASGPGAILERASLRPTPAVLRVPDGHRLAGAASVRVSDLDGERLLTWSPAGTPFTDLLLARVAAGGARVEPVEAHITGGQSLMELRELDAIAVVPAGWPPADGVAEVPLEDVTLPLVLLWSPGPPSPAVQRIRAAMAVLRRD